MTVRVLFSPDAFVQPVGGISRYIARLHTELRRLGAHSTIISGLHWNEYLSTTPGTVGLRLPGWSRRTPALRGARIANGWATAAAISVQRTPIIFHPSYYTAPLAPRDVLSVVVVYDMIHEMFPDSLLPSERNVVDAKRQWLTRASLVIAISHQTRDDVLRLYDLDPERVVVIYPGVDPRTETRLGRPWPRSFILYVGSRSSYKNFGRFLEVFGETPAATDFDLVVFGGAPLNTWEQVTAKTLGVRLHRARGADSQLAAYYRDAHAFVCPSRYEGFGFPPLEAMTYGCPVACSRGGSLGEVVGDAAVMFDPDSREEMARAVEQVCFDESLRRKLSSKGLIQAARYTWRAAGQSTLGRYEQVLAERWPGRRC